MCVMVVIAEVMMLNFTFTMREIVFSIQVSNSRPDVKIITVNPDEEYEKVKNSLNQLPRCKLSGKIIPFSIC